MIKISFFYRDIGLVAGAIAQRANYFIDAVNTHAATDNAQLLVYCANVSQSHSVDGLQIRQVKSFNTPNSAGLFFRALDEIALGCSVVFKTAFKRSDIFVISTPPYISGLIIAVFHLIFRRRFALDIRDMYPRAYLDAGLLTEEGWLHKLINRINKFVFKRATFIVCATRGQSVEVESLTRDTEICVIYNGFPSDFLDLAKPRLKGFRVVTHGTLGVYQHVTFMVELAKSLEHEGVEFVIIGRGVKAKIIEDSGAKNIKFLGELPFEEVIKEVATCDVGLCVRDDSLQSRYSFPVKAWEYIGLRMPMLIFPPGEVSDVFPSLDGIHVFESINVDAFKSVILQLKAKKASSDRGVVVLEGKAIEAYTREVMAEKFADLVARHCDLHHEK